VLKAICQYLSLQEAIGRCVFWRQNNGATYDAKRGAYRATTGTGYKYGVPDVSIILTGGRYVACEVKASSGRLSEHQNALKTSMEKIGATYIVARGVEDVEGLFNGGAK
jgi:hypothetical protein